MAKTHQLIQSFRGGIISPLMQANADAERFKNSLSRGENFMILPDGSALMRPGMTFVTAAKDNTSPKRLEVFQWDVDYLLEFGELYVRVYENDLSGLKVEFVTPYTAADLDLMKFAQKNEVMVTTHPDHPPQRLEYNSPTDTFSFGEQALIIPQYDFNDSKSPVPSDTINDLTLTGSPNFEYALKYGGPRSDPIVLSGNAATNESNIRIALESLPTIGSSTTVTVVETTGVYRVTISGPDAGKGAIEGIGITDGMTVGTTVIDAGGGQDEDAWSSTYDADSPGGAVPPGRGWPVSITVFEQRLIFGGSKSIFDGFWGSAIQDYPDFTIGVLDHQAYFFRLDTREPTKIFWAETAPGFLAIGTRNGVYSARGDGGAMTPTSFLVTRPTSYRCSGHQGKAIASELLFVEGGHHKIRNLMFSDERQTQLSYDLSFMISHLTADSINDFYFMEFPEKYLFAVKEDGHLLQCAYSVENDLLAWTHWSTDGIVKDITIITSAGTHTGSESLAVLVERAGELMIEVVNMNIYSVADDAEHGEYGWATLPYLDSNVRYEGASTVTIPGLDHLEGRGVEIIVNGAVHPSKTVTGGQVILDWAGTDVIVGLRYENELATVQQSLGNQGGTALGTKRRWNRAFLNVATSVRPVVNGVSVADRTPATPMDTPEPLVSEELEYRLRKWERGVISIVNPYNLACCVSAVYGESNVERQ